MDDVAQDLFARRVAPDQFLFRDCWNEMASREGPVSAPPKERDLSSLASVDFVDNFGEVFIGAIVVVTVGASPYRPVACGADTRPVRDPSRPIGPV